MNKAFAGEIIFYAKKEKLIFCILGITAEGWMKKKMF